MFVVHSYALAVAFCVLTMLCWGSWAVTKKLARPEWRFELFYWDYTLGVLLITLALGITLGNSGTEGRAFFSDLSQASTASLIAALLGGAVFNLGNILLVAAIEIAGMAVAFPVGIGLALIIGVIMNYVADPVGNVALLSAGVFFVILAIILDALAYRRLAGGSTGANSAKGLPLAVACGVFMGIFYRFIAASMYTDTAHPTAGKMGSYAAVFVVAVGILLSSFVWNTFAMKRPFVGPPVEFRRLLRGEPADPHDRPVGRRDLGSRHVAQPHRLGARRLRNLLRARPGRHDDRGDLGRIHLEGISHGTRRHEHVAGHHVR